MSGLLAAENLLKYAAVEGYAIFSFLRCHRMLPSSVMRLRY
jgi:hypothetical protein